MLSAAYMMSHASHLSNYNATLWQLMTLIIALIESHTTEHDSMTALHGGMTMWSMLQCRIQMIGVILVKQLVMIGKTAIN